jgi:hypothetical protein
VYRLPSSLKGVSGKVEYHELSIFWGFYELLVTGCTFNAQEYRRCWDFHVFFPERMKRRRTFVV